MSPQKISIVIPVLNGEKSLRACLTSVLQQDTDIHECIVVDNNSTDTTADIIKEFQTTHANVVYVFEEVKSRGAARKTGVDKATGDIIVMTDVDCVVSSNWITELTKPIMTGQEVVTTGYQYNTLENNYWAREMQRKCDYFLNFKTLESGYISFTDTKNLAVKASLLKEFNFDSRFVALEDVDLEFKLRPVARFRYLPNVKVGHAHSQTMRAVWKLAYERSYWYAQLYHKFVNVRDSNGIIIFQQTSPFRFYVMLFAINLHALKVQGFKHILFFIVFDLAWKIGSGVGYAHIEESLRKKNLP